MGKADVVQGARCESDLMQHMRDPAPILQAFVTGARHLAQIGGVRNLLGN